ncbi:MAG: DNA polymerase IV [Candidatus Pacebacteria bacterium]|nr:DNA polymerase IV [Candidatus Paceibacterota bacterium]
MKNAPILTSSYPRAILHVDADAFFAAVEEALDPSLRGKPVVTGKERGIIACANYPGKGLGIARGIPLFTARKMCPELIILPSDYETYGIYSKRMFEIMRRYTPSVEEYSVDEAFLDITGMRGVFRTSYENIARKLQAEIVAELGITVSVGLSLSKCLAKLCSKFRKPNGLTAVPGRYIHILLERTPLEKVWGFGPNTVSLLKKYGLRTAYDYVMKPEAWARRLLHSPGHDLWLELRGDSVMKVCEGETSPQYTIIKSKTFTPPSADREYVFARLMRNVESAFMKARRHNLRVRRLGVVLRHQDFHHSGMEGTLSHSTGCSIEATPLIRRLFDASYQSGSDYRSTMIAMGGLECDRTEQLELFGDGLSIDNIRHITEAIDTINRRYGKHTVCSASALYLDRKQWDSRDDHPQRRQNIIFKGENERQRVGIPRWSINV